MVSPVDCISKSPVGHFFRTSHSPEVCPRNGVVAPDSRPAQDPFADDTLRVCNKPIRQSGEKVLK